MSVSVGIDVGATFCKVCVMRDGMIVSLQKKKTPIMQTSYFSELRTNLEHQYGNLRIVSCGYGRSNTDSEDEVSELSALAIGAAFICPEVHTLWDIGGQDTKLIVHNGGKVTNFALNDKCAAGGGIFLMNTMNLLDIEFSEIMLTTEEPKPLSTVCAVYAQTEIVKRLALGESAKTLILAVLRSILEQSATLFNKVSSKPTIALTGGLSEICGVDEVASEISKNIIVVPRNSSYLSAIGCAILAEKI